MADLLDCLDTPGLALLQWDEVFSVVEVILSYCLGPLPIDSQAWRISGSAACSAKRIGRAVSLQLLESFPSCRAA